MNEYEAGVSITRLVFIGVAIAGSAAGLLVGLVRWLGARLMADIDARLVSMNDVVGRSMVETARVDADLKRLLADLPMHYQRREDSIREYTALNAKIDRIYELIVRRAEVLK